jgi:hypothetical protein
MHRFRCAVITCDKVINPLGKYACQVSSKSNHRLSSYLSEIINQSRPAACSRLIKYVWISLAAPEILIGRGHLAYDSTLAAKVHLIYTETIIYVNFKSLKNFNWRGPWTPWAPQSHLK